MRTSLLLAVVVASAPAFAQGAPEAASAAAPAPGESPRAAFLAGVQAGGLFPFQGLKPNVEGSLDVGVLLPWADRSFGLLASVGYTQPVASGTVSDPRVPGGSYDWKLVQQQLTIAPTLLYRLTALGVVVPYLAASFRIFLLQQTVSGSAGGQAFSPTVERGTRYGVGGRLGAEIKLGPGGITVEGLFEWARLATLAAGAGTQIMSVSVSAGYRLIL